MRVPVSANGDGRGTVQSVVSGLDRREVLQALARVQHQRGLLDVMQRVLEARLTSLTTSSNGHYPTDGQDHDGAQWRTVEEVATELRLSKAYVYALIQRGELRAMTMPGDKGYLRVSRDAVATFIKEHSRKP